MQNYNSKFKNLFRFRNLRVFRFSFFVFRSCEARGNVLLLSLLVMASIIVSGMAIGGLIMRQIRMAKDVESSQFAFYAAESGTEKGLYQIEKIDKLPSEIRESGVALEKSGASYSKIGTDRKEEIYRASLKQGESLIIDLYGDESSAEGFKPAGVSSLKMKWKGESQIEIKEYSPWNYGDIINWEDETSVITYQCLNSPCEENLFNCKDSACRLKITPQDDIRDLKITVYSLEGEVVEIPAGATIIETSGKFTSQRQAIEARIPKPPPSALSFTIDQDVASAGEERLLSWTTQDVDSCTLKAEPTPEGWVEGVTTIGSRTVFPEVTTVYTLTCKGFGDWGEKSIEVTAIVAKRIFVTSEIYSGNLGGIIGADAECQELADLANEGVGLGETTWQALLSDNLTDANSRTSNVYYANMNWEIIAMNYASLWDGGIDRPIKMDENGKIISEFARGVWTGTSTSGENTGNNCSDWVDLSASSGTYGSSYENGGEWIEIGSTSCGNRLHLYCFEL